MLFRQLFHRLFSSNLAVVETRECPNCWGWSEWECEFPLHFDIDKGQPSEVASRNGFIRRFVKRYLG